MTWLLLNIPLMFPFVAAAVGIPLWLVFKYPDTGRTAGHRDVRGMRNGIG